MRRIGWAVGMVAGGLLAQEAPRPQPLSALPLSAPAKEPKKAPASAPAPAPAPSAPAPPPAPMPTPAPAVEAVPGPRPGVPQALAPKVDPIARGLRYLLRVRLRGEAEPLLLRFRLVPTPARTTGNKVKKPRLGGWRLEAERGQGGQLSPAWMLARAERLLYVSGSAPQLQAEPWALSFGRQSCPVWSVDLPAALKGAVYLVEIAPGLLALCDLTVKFDRGDIAALDLHLEAFGWRPGTAPPENGTALLGTLQRWAQQPPAAAGETERVE